MTDPRVTVVVPTHNRPALLTETLAGLRSQDLPIPDYEIVVVDDGSKPPVQIPRFVGGPEVGLIRLGGSERSTARNVGAAAARGELLVFVDDDMSVGPNFLTQYLHAHAQWPDTLLVGATELPAEARRKPFGRFRYRLERQGVPTACGPVGAANFCAAGNMAIPRHQFLTLGGFDSELASGEDQDLALRHSASGRRIVFVPGAAAVHRDRAMDVRGYCRRHEWGAEQLLPFCRRYPEWPDNVIRAQVNGLAGPADGAVGRLRKGMKSLLAGPAVTEILFVACSYLERTAPDSRLLDKLYHVLLGTHIFRGYRRGIARSQQATRRVA